jgi:hypothetical protein
MAGEGVDGGELLQARERDDRPEVNLGLLMLAAAEFAGHESPAEPRVQQSGALKEQAILSLKKDREDAGAGIEGELGGVIAPGAFDDAFAGVPMGDVSGRENEQSASGKQVTASGTE